MSDDESVKLHLPRFTAVLIDSVEGGALVGHVLQIDRAAANAYWSEMVSSAGRGERILVCATEGGRLAGTVQLSGANAPHSGEVYKLVVHREFRARGIGAALTHAVEREARQPGRTFLLLDTVQGGSRERLYHRMGWQEIGLVPRHFVDPWINFQTSVYIMRFVEP